MIDYHGIRSKVAGGVDSDPVQNNHLFQLSNMGAFIGTMVKDLHWQVQ